MAQFATSRPTPQYQQPFVNAAPVGYKAPQPVEVYVLNDHANASIPPEIRQQFQRDEQGRILWFTAPPLNTSPIVHRPGQPLGHSARYLAAKAERDAKIAAKRKADEADAAARADQAKKARTEAATKFEMDVEALSLKAMTALEDQLALATKKDLQALFNSEDSTEGIMKRLDGLSEMQKVAIAKNREREARQQQQKRGNHTPITGMTVRLEEKY
jgi:chromatin structure-remodeling complex subunit RSC1/2